MAYIGITLDHPLQDGEDVKFKAPCDCTAVSGLQITYQTGVEGETDTKTFSFADSHGNNLSGLGNLFMSGAYVKVMVDTGSGKAYIQNADTNAYLENQFGPGCINTEKLANGSITEEKLAEGLELGVTILKLWENASLPSGFAAQTVALNLGEYDGIIVVFVSDSGKGLSGSYVALVKNLYNEAMFQNGMYKREFQMTDSGVQFFDGSYNNGANNAAMLPYLIFGIKGVQ